jgi:hypothetical protein
MNEPIIKFLVVLSLALVLIFLIHITVLEIFECPLFANLIVLSYLVNYGLAISVYLLLFALRKKYMESLGFIFMGGSFFKFIIFFIFFYPVYRKDGSTNTLETTAFLVPYLSCLFIEIYALAKLLKRDS